MLDILVIVGISTPTASSILWLIPLVKPLPSPSKMPSKMARLGLATTFTFCVLLACEDSLDASCCTVDVWPDIPSLTASLTASAKLFSSCLLKSDSTVIVIVLLESPPNLSSNSSRLLVSVLTLIGLLSKYLLTCLRCCTLRFKC